MIWFAIAIGLLVILIVLLLPASLTAKLSSVAVGVGMIFTAYSLYSDTQLEKKTTRRREVDRNNDYWTKIFSTFIASPVLAGMHQQIYGNNIPAAEHSMFSLMIQTVENVVESSEYGINGLDASWQASILKWISHPDFKTYWIQNRDDYTYRTQNEVDYLLTLI